MRQGSREFRRQLSSTIIKHYTIGIDSGLGQRLANGVRGCVTVCWGGGQPNGAIHSIRECQAGQTMPDFWPPKKGDYATQDFSVCATEHQFCEFVLRAGAARER